MKRRALVFFCISLIVACAGCPKAPTKEMAEARAALDSAKDAGAPVLAPDEYRSAEQMLAEATAYMEGKKYDDARSSALTSKKLADVARDKALRGRGGTEGGAPSEGAGPAMVPQGAEVTGKGSLGEGVKIRELEPVYFAFDDYSISEEAKGILKADAEWLAKNPQVRVQIEGHCDDRGSPEYNLALGEKRAKSAKNYLIQLGTDPGRLSTISYGKERPADPGHTDEAWAKNRRAELIVR